MAADRGVRVYTVGIGTAERRDHRRRRLVDARAPRRGVAEDDRQHDARRVLLRRHRDRSEEGLRDAQLASSCWRRRKPRSPRCSPPPRRCSRCSPRCCRCSGSTASCSCACRRVGECGRRIADAHCRRIHPCHVRHCSAPAGPLLEAAPSQRADRRRRPRGRVRRLRLFRGAAARQVEARVATRRASAARRRSARSNSIRSRCAATMTDFTLAHRTPGASLFHFDALDRRRSSATLWRLAPVLNALAHPPDASRSPATPTARTTSRT